MAIWETLNFLKNVDFFPRLATFCMTELPLFLVLFLLKQLTLYVAAFLVLPPYEFRNYDCKFNSAKVLSRAQLIRMNRDNE